MSPQHANAHVVKDDMHVDYDTLWQCQLMNLMSATHLLEPLGINLIAT